MEVEIIKKFEIIENNIGNNQSSEQPMKVFNKHNNSVCYDSKKISISRQEDHNSSFNSVFNTLEPDTPTLDKAKFELPKLSSNRERKRNSPPDSFAKKINFQLDFQLQIKIKINVIDLQC